MKMGFLVRPRTPPKHHAKTIRARRASHCPISRGRRDQCMSTLPTAYIALQGARVRLEGGSLVVEHAAHPPSIIQLAHLGGLVALGGIEFTTPALIALAQRGIGCVLATRGGRVRAIVTSPTARHCELRRMQHALEVERAQAETNAPRPLEFARRSVRAKLDALLGILVQHHRTHDDVELSQPIALIRALRDRIERAASIDQLRGFEGAAMARYFATMPALCRGELTTATRSRQPPQDPMNSALSFGYALIVGELTATLHARGLDPALGLMHPPTDGRPSLALDLVEPLRHAIIDRLVLRAANRRELLASDFERFSEAGVSGVRFTDAGRGKFLSLYQTAMSAEMTDGASAPRAVRMLLADIVEEYERALEPMALSDFAPIAVV